MDISFKSTQLYNKLEDLENERAQLNLKIKYYQSIQKYLNSSTSIEDLVAPSAVGIDDPLLTNLINTLTELYEEASLYGLNNLF